MGFAAAGGKAHAQPLHLFSLLAKTLKSVYTTGKIDI